MSPRGRSNNFLGSLFLSSLLYQSLLDQVIFT
jgi:hypothetical protein